MAHSTTAALFSPVRVGPYTLAHRVVMAPLTRSRSQQPGDVPGELMATYYAQRASDGGLIVSEATAVSVAGRGWFGAPGLYDDAQVHGWRRVTDAVHAKGGRIFAQLWHVGRSSHVSMTGGAAPVSASVDPRYWLDATASISTPAGWAKPSPHRALAAGEVPAVVAEYRRAAERAMAAGFDGVELHAANGYLPDQFLQDGSNRRTDAYGGPFENRCRFVLEVVAAMAAAWGGDRVAVRIGPAGTWNNMSDRDPTGLFDHLAGELNRFGLAYLHVIEPRIRGNEWAEPGGGPVAAEHLRTVFSGTLIAAGGFEPDTAAAVVKQGTADLVAFGRHFISNPDLPDRIRRGRPLAAYDRATFYTFDARGYSDYPADHDRPAAAKSTDLLSVAVAAHGGLDRWNRVTAVRVAASITGAIWHVKGKPDVLADVVMTADTKAERLRTDFPGQDKQTVFEPDRVVVRCRDGTALASRDDPEASFAGHRRETPWDDVHVAYFGGEALWTYLNTPFLYTWPGFATEEIAPIVVDGETWRRLRVTFPDQVKSHTRVQVSCFGPDGLLRRHDYTVDVLGGATGLNYASDYRDVDGIVIPTRRRVYAYTGDYQRVDEPLLVAIDMGEITLA